MKKLLLVMLVLPYAALSQILNIDAGASLNIPPAKYAGVIDVYARVSPVLNLQYIVKRKKTRLYGVSIEYTQLRGTYKLQYTNINAEPIGSYKHPLNYGKYSLSAQGLGGHMFSMERNQISIGLLIGIVVNINDPITKIYKNYDEIEGNAQTNFGAVVGAFFDYRYYLNERIGFGISVVPKYYRLYLPKTKYLLQDNLGILALSATTGLTIKL